MLCGSDALWSVVVFPFYGKWPWADGAQVTWHKGVFASHNFIMTSVLIIYVHQDHLVKTHMLIIKRRLNLHSSLLLLCGPFGSWLTGSCRGFWAKNATAFFFVTCCLARSSNSNNWTREKRIIQPALLQVCVESHTHGNSWEVKDDFHSV